MNSFVVVFGSPLEAPVGKGGVFHRALSGLQIRRYLDHVFYGLSTVTKFDEAEASEKSS